MPAIKREEAHEMTKAGARPKIKRGGNRTLDLIYVRHMMSRAGLSFSTTGEQLLEAVRRMSLPEKHTAALPPKSLMTVLTHLLKESEFTCKQLRWAINELDGRV